MTYRILHIPTAAYVSECGLGSMYKSFRSRKDAIAYLTKHPLFKYYMEDNTILLWTNLPDTKRITVEQFEIEEVI